MANGDCGVIRAACCRPLWALVGAQLACGDGAGGEVAGAGISVTVERLPEAIALQPEPDTSEALLAAVFDRSSPGVQCSADQLALLRRTERELSPRLASVLDYLARIPVDSSLREPPPPLVGYSASRLFGQSFGEATEQAVSEVTAAFALIAARVESATVQYYCLPGDFEFSNGWQCDADGVTGHTFRQLEFVDLCPRAFGTNSTGVDSADAMDKLAMTIVHELSHQNRNSVRGVGTTDGLPRLRPDYAYSYERLLRNWYPSLRLGN